MKERKIKIIIGLMSAAVIGLIAVQIFWITHAISIEKMRFETNVNEALTKVVEKADKLETASVLINKIVPGKNKVLILDSDVSVRDTGIIWNMSKENEIGRLPEEQEVRIEFLGDTDSGFVHVITETIDDSITNIRKIERNIETVDSFIVKKSKLVNTIVDELIYRRSFSEKNLFFTEDVIDSLLENELNNKGITTEYYFSISNKNSDKKFFNNDSDFKIKDDAFHKVQLNPDDVFHKASFLSVYFPDKGIFIIKSIAWVLAVSAILIIIIIAVFYKTIQLLLKQKRLTEIKNDLINNITHEFKTPISTISLACEALNEPVLLANPNSVNRYSSMIKDENNRLSDLVENLLNTAAIEKDEFKLEFERTDLHEIIKEIITNYKIKFEQKGANVRLNLRAGNPVISADKFHISNCFNNMIDNAYKYTRDNPEIVVETESTNEEIIIKIIDNGIGIKKQDLNRIFDTFFRIPTGNIHDVKGNGIGLSYTKKMIEAHKGSINVKSKPEHGSTFIVSLPYEK